MKQLFILSFHFLRVFLVLVAPDGTKALVAENIMLRKQLILANRHRKKAPCLNSWDRLSFAVLAALIFPKRLARLAIIIKPSTLIKLHKAFINRKYQALFTNKHKRKPGPAGPSRELINAILKMKKRNPRFGCRRIAMQINNIFGENINKDVVWRVLAKYYKPHVQSNITEKHSTYISLI